MEVPNSSGEMAQDNRLDVIVFGATGCTGMYVVENLIKTIDKENQELKWGIAGRNETKTKQVLDVVSKYVGKNLDGIPILVADINEEDSIMRMCQRARIIVNCVGPYTIFGEVVVRNCVAAKTHYVDIAGEPYFLESMQLKYHSKAADAGVLIVGACGFDSIPADLGIINLRQNCPGEIAWVDTFAETKSGPHGSVVNHGTWDAALQFFAKLSELKDIRKQLYGNFFKKEFPVFKYKNDQKYLPYTPNEIGRLTVPFWETDKFVVKRTQMQNFIELNERPIQMSAYLVVGSWLKVFGLSLVGLLFVIFASFSLGRKLLKKHPKFFTVGNVTLNGPSREQVSGASFGMTLVGHGWREKQKSPTEEPNSPPEQLIVGRWSGPEAAYEATSIFLIQSAITILKERETIAHAGGVITPGLAFRGTSLIERLGRYGITFEIVKKA